MSRPLAIVSTGMLTGVGLNASSSCAAMRGGITAFEETQFLDRGRQWILGAAVPLPTPYQGTERLIRLASAAIRETLSSIPKAPAHNIPLMLCVAEPGRPGRLDDLDDTLLSRLESDLGIQLHKESRVIPQGRMAGVTAIQLARSAVNDAGFPFCLVVGVDSFLCAPTLADYEARYRLLTSENSNGFIPGEAAAAVLLGPAGTESKLRIVGLGSGSEPAPIESGEPLRADGLVTAFKAVLSDAGITWEQLDFRICDINGEQYFFREAALALTRTLRVRKPEFDLWHAADCIGEVGAAAVPVALATAFDATVKDYAPGPGIICHFSCDGPERAAVVLQAA